MRSEPQEVEFVPPSPETVRSRLRRAALPTLAGLLVLLASLSNFLTHYDYPLLRPEVGILIVLSAALALLAGGLYAVSGPLGRAALQGLLVFLAFDLNFNGRVVVLGTLITLVVINRRLIPFLSVAAGVVFVTDVAGEALEDHFSGDTQRPVASLAESAPRAALLHVIVDEHIGFEGLLGQDPDITSVRDKLKKLYLEQGFRVFGGAYSEYYQTSNAIPQMLNLGNEQPWEDGQRDGLIVKQNQYFETLNALGYRPHVYQTDYIRFCGSNLVASCREYKQQDIGVIADSTLFAGEKAGIVLYNFARLSWAARRFIKYYDKAVSRAKFYRAAVPPMKATPIGALSMLDELVRDLRNAEPGSAYFAHLLVPHDPYVLDSDCSLKRVWTWRTRFSAGVSSGDIQSAYIEQIECVATQIKRAVDALRSSRAGRNFVVILHGDHGFRGALPDPRAENIGRFSEHTLVRSHSTLFAVHGSGIKAGYESRRIPVALLLKALAASSFQSADVQLPADFSPSVVLSDVEWRPVRRYPLPAWWNQPSTE